MVATETKNVNGTHRQAKRIPRLKPDGRHKLDRELIEARRVAKVIGESLAGVGLYERDNLGRPANVYTGGATVRATWSIPLGTRLTMGYGPEDPRRGVLIGATEEHAIMLLDGGAGVYVVEWQGVFLEALAGGIGEEASNCDELEELGMLADSFASTTGSEDLATEAAQSAYRDAIAPRILALCSGLWPRPREQGEPKPETTPPGSVTIPVRVGMTASGVFDSRGRECTGEIVDMDGVGFVIRANDAPERDGKLFRCTWADGIVVKATAGDLAGGAL